MRRVVYKRPTDNNIRTITADEWRSVGVEDQETLVWDRFNNWSIDEGLISAAAMDHIVRDPDLFIQADAEGEVVDDGAHSAVSTQDVRPADRAKRKLGNG